MDICVSFLIVPDGTIALIAKTVASGLVNCQETTLRNVYCYAALNRLNNIGYKIFDILLLNVMQFILLISQINNEYCMVGHIVQGGAV
jgi:hypothetical protein